MLSKVWSPVGRSPHPKPVPYSPPKLSRYVSVRLNWALVTVAPCLKAPASGWPLWASHTRAVWSLDAVTTLAPFGLKCADITCPYVSKAESSARGLCIPDARCLVPRGGYHPFAIGAELRPAYLSVMNQRRRQWFAAPRVPHAAVLSDEAVTTCFPLRLNRADCTPLRCSNGFMTG